MSTAGAAGSLRMQVWRKLRSLGALYLQQSVCLLPAQAEVLREVRRLVARVHHQGGAARVLQMAFTDPADEQAVIAEFNAARDAEYAELLGRLPELRRESADEQTRGNLTYAEVEESEADLQRFSTWLTKIADRDYFNAPGRQPPAPPSSRPPPHWPRSRKPPYGQKPPNLPPRRRGCGWSTSHDRLAVVRHGAGHRRRVAAGLARPHDHAAGRPPIRRTAARSAATAARRATPGPLRGVGHGAHCTEQFDPPHRRRPSACVDIAAHALDHEVMASAAEEHLVGGNNATEVVRIGDTVHRTRGPRSAYAADVLRYLESIGYAHAPRYLGVDDQGRDVLGYIPGRTTDHPTQRAEGAYARAGMMLRQLHEATARHPLAGDQDCVIHGDAGPFNTIFQDGLPVAFIDWTGCGPGVPLDDLGYLAWTWCIQALGHVPIDDQVAHLRELRDGYGDVDAEQLLDAMIQQQTRIVELETANFHNPRFSPTRRAHARKAVTWAESDRALIHQHHALLLSALR